MDDSPPRRVLYAAQDPLWDEFEAGDLQRFGLSEKGDEITDWVIVISVG